MPTIFKKQSRINSLGNESHNIKFNNMTVWSANDSEHLDKGFDKLNSYQALEPKGFMKFYNGLPMHQQIKFNEETVRYLNLVAIGMGYQESI